MPFSSSCLEGESKHRHLIMFCGFCSCLSQHFRFSWQVISVPGPPTAAHWFEFIVCTEVSVLGWRYLQRSVRQRRAKGVSGAWIWREGGHVIGVSHWDFRGDYVNLSVGHVTALILSFLNSKSALSERFRFLTPNEKNNTKICGNVL